MFDISLQRTTAPDSVPPCAVKPAGGCDAFADILAGLPTTIQASAEDVSPIPWPAETSAIPDPLSTIPAALSAAVPLGATNSTVVNSDALPVDPIEGSAASEPDPVEDITKEPGRRFAAGRSSDNVDEPAPKKHRDDDSPRPVLSVAMPSQPPLVVELPASDEAFVEREQPARQPVLPPHAMAHAALHDDAVPELRNARELPNVHELPNARLPERAVDRSAAEPRPFARLGSQTEARKPAPRSDRVFETPASVSTPPAVTPPAPSRAEETRERLKAILATLSPVMPAPAVSATVTPSAHATATAAAPAATPAAAAPISVALAFAAPISAAIASVAPTPVAPISTAPIATVPVSTVPVSTVPVSTVPASTVPVSTVLVSSVPDSTALVSSVSVSVPISAAPISIGSAAEESLPGPPTFAAPDRAVPPSAAPVSAAPSAAAPAPVAPISDELTLAAPISAAPVSTVPASAAPLSAAPISPATIAAEPIPVVPISVVPNTATPIAVELTSSAPIATTTISTVPLAAPASSNSGQPSQAESTPPRADAPPPRTDAHSPRSDSPSFVPVGEALSRDPQQQVEGVDYKTAGASLSLNVPMPTTERVRERDPQMVAARLASAGADVSPAPVLQFNAAPASLLAGGAVTVMPRLPLAPARVTLPNETAAARSIVQTLRLQAVNGGGTAVITLTPEYLGSVTVSLHVKDGGVVATMQAENSAVRGWIESNVSLLRDGLAEQGLKLEQMVVTERPAPDLPEDARREHRNGEQTSPRRMRRRDDRTFEVIA